MGPFLDTKSKDLVDGDISYKEPSGELTFLDY
jgi:DNA polymerase II small subunit/DNA polymerase delta subunit B